MYKVKIIFTEPILGTVPGAREIYSDYVAGSITPEAVEEENLTVNEAIQKGSTGFHTLDDGTPILYDYVFKGFLKDACGMLRRVSGTRSAKLSAYKKVIDGLVFVSPRRIPLILPAGGKMSYLERPLRASTAQGERVALARSDTCPAGTRIEITLTILGVVTEAMLREWLDYGQLRGLGQWRNAGYGSFTYELEEL